MGPRVRLLSGVMFVLMALTGPFIRAGGSPAWAQYDPLEGLQLHCIVCSTAVYSLCTKARKKEPRVRWWRQTPETERAAACRSWSGSIKGPPSALLWSERRGWRFRVHSSLFIPWRCVKKPGLGPCRHAGLGRIILSWPTADRGAPLHPEPRPLHAVEKQSQQSASKCP